VSTTTPAGTSSTGASGAPARNVTLNDVAKEAGVSPGTASKALNDRFDVSTNTRDRVREVADRLGFVPNALARTLTAGRSHTVGILTNDLEGRFVSQIMVGAEMEIGREQSTVLLANSDGDLARQTSHLQALLERRVDGLIIVDERMEVRPPLHVHGGTPIVYAFGMSSDPADTSVVPDVRGGERDAVVHLRSAGRRRLAHIGGETTSYSANERERGFLDVAPETDPSRILRGDYSEQWGWEATGRLLDVHPRPDGIVAGNDQIARGAIDRIQAAGLRVPQDIAVVGYDDWQVLSLLGRTPITTVDMRLGELGAEAVRQLYGQQRTPGRVLIPPRLIPRYSTVGVSNPRPHDAPLPERHP
jgi:LacI family transcriptional regulator